MRKITATRLIPEITASAWEWIAAHSAAWTPESFKFHFEPVLDALLCAVMLAVGQSGQLDAAAHIHRIYCRVASWYIRALRRAIMAAAIKVMPAKPYPRE